MIFFIETMKNKVNKAQPKPSPPPPKCFESTPLNSSTEFKGDDGFVEAQLVNKFRFHNEIPDNKLSVSTSSKSFFPSFFFADQCLLCVVSQLVSQSSGASLALNITTTNF